jgi:hypothetical protein
MLGPELFFVFFALFLVVAVLGFLAWFVISGALRGRKGRTTWQAHAADAADDGTSALRFNQRVELSGLGSGAKGYMVHPGTKARPPYLEVFVHWEARGDFRIIPETWFDRLCKRIGLAKEIQTRDADFDERFYILTETPELARRMFEMVENRRLVTALFDLGFRDIAFDGQRFKAEWPNFQWKQERNLDLVRQAVEALQGLTQRLPADAAGEQTRAPARVKPGVTGAWALVVGLLLTVTALLWYQPLRTWPLFGFSLAFSLPAMLVFLWATALVVRGRSSSHRQFLALLLGSVIAFPLGGYSVAVFLNGALDRGEPSRHTLTVTQKWESTSSGRGRTRRYNVSLPHWKRPGEQVVIQVSSGDFASIAPLQTRVEVTVYPGWLGYERISSWSVRH